MFGAGRFRDRSILCQTVRDRCSVHFTWCHGQDGRHSVFRFPWDWAQVSKGFVATPGWTLLHSQIGPFSVKLGEHQIANPSLCCLSVTDVDRVRGSRSTGQCSATFSEVTAATGAHWVRATWCWASALDLVLTLIGFLRVRVTGNSCGGASDVLVGRLCFRSWKEAETK